MNDQVPILLQRVLSGDHAALQALFEATAPQVHGVVYSLLGDESRAAEVTKAVFTALTRERAVPEPFAAQPVDWLYALARRHAMRDIYARGAAAGPALPEGRAASLRAEIMRRRGGPSS